jgi:hypothetical protein
MLSESGGDQRHRGPGMDRANSANAHSISLRAVRSTLRAS